MKPHQLVLSFALACSAPAVAVENVRFAVGHGTQYGGMVGVRLSYVLEHLRLNAGLGMLGASESTGFHAGYSVGFDLPVARNHVVGVHIGTTGVSTFSTPFSGDAVTYRGADVSYSYYFSGVQNQSWQLGASYIYGRADDDHYRLPDSQNGARLVFGYQF